MWQVGFTQFVVQLGDWTPGVFISENHESFFLSDTGEFSEVVCSSKWQ